MSRVDELLRETLTAEPQPAGDEGWDRVARRGGQLARRRRRVRRAGIAGAVVLALVVVSAVVLQRGSNQRSRSIFTNPAPDGATIVASTNDGVVTMDPSDGRVLDHLVDISPTANRGTTAPDVALSPDGTTLYYTRPSATDRCGRSAIVERTIATGSERDLVYGSAPVVSADGRWIAYTTSECSFDGQFLAITSLPGRLHYRPYEQLLGEQPSKLRPLAWSPGDQLIWTRLHAGDSDQQTLRLSSPPLDHGEQPTTLPARQPVSAATYLTDGRLAVAQGTTDRWELDVLDDDGNIVSTRFRATGPMPTALAAAPRGDVLLVTMPDGRLLIQVGNAEPRAVATGVTSAAWLDPATTTETSTTAPPTSTTPTTTTDAGPLDVDAAQPSFDEQVEQLETWYHNWPAEAPGGRPVLSAEWTYCDYTNNPDAGSAPHIGIPNAPAVQPTFASYSKLSEPLTQARLADGCFYRADRFPGGTPANVPVETPDDQLPAYVFCATDQRGPSQVPGASRLEVVLKPAIVFGGTDCTAAGYQDPPSGFIATLDHRRHVEIELRAVPKACPTADDAARWAQHVAQQELGQTWQVGGAGSTATCARPAYIDWDNHTAGLMMFTR
jgi:hypothetical protein